MFRKEEPVAVFLIFIQFVLFGNANLREGLVIELTRDQILQRSTVRKGMSSDEVRKALGSPNAQESGGPIGHSYHIWTYHDLSLIIRFDSSLHVVSVNGS